MSDFLLVEEHACRNVLGPVVSLVWEIGDHIWKHAQNTGEVDEYMSHSIFEMSNSWFVVFMKDPQDHDS